MAAKKLKNLKKLNLFLVIFSLLVVAVIAFIISQPALFKSGASNSTSLSGLLIKRNANGSFTYSIASGGGKRPSTADVQTCKNMPASGSGPESVVYNYAIVTSGSGDDRGPRLGGVQTGTKKCVALVVSASLADPFVGKNVSAKGVYKSGFFYATSLTGGSAPSKDGWSGAPTSKPTPSPVVRQTPPVRILPR